MARHELARLQHAAAKVSLDLNAAGDERWSCSVGSDFLLTMYGPWGRATVDLRTELDEGWFLHGSFTSRQQDESMSRGAEELVAQQAIVLLRAQGIAWPWCPQHNAPVEASEGFWICGDDPQHDLAAVGHLCMTEAPSPLGR